MLIRAKKHIGASHSSNPKASRYSSLYFIYFSKILARSTGDPLDIKILHVDTGTWNDHMHYFYTSTLFFPPFPAERSTIGENRRNDVPIITEKLRRGLQSEYTEIEIVTETRIETFYRDSQIVNDPVD